mmetsp:Transcript_9213/g.11438  ORF Transcript_9213/g.11438 Transcript_9213/m.11438 type:complete len:127 (-) Transcript_9213:6-386(-)
MLWITTIAGIATTTTEPSGAFHRHKPWLASFSSYYQSLVFTWFSRIDRRQLNKNVDEGKEEEGNDAGNGGGDTGNDGGYSGVDRGDAGGNDVTRDDAVSCYIYVWLGHKMLVCHILAHKYNTEALM